MVSFGKSHLLTFFVIITFCVSFVGVSIILMIKNFKLYNFYFFQANDLYSIKILSIACSDIDPIYILNITCYVKAQRDKLGLVNVRFYFKNVDNMMTHIAFQYRNSAGRYLPFLVDYTYDNCKFVELARSGSATFKFVLSLLPVDFKDFESCPLNVTKRLDYFSGF